MNKTQYPDPFVTHLEGFHIDSELKNQIVVDEEPSFTQIMLSSPLVFDSVKIEFSFRSPPNVSNSFRNFDFGAHMYTEIDYSIKQYI